MMNVQAQALVPSQVLPVLSVQPSPGQHSSDGEQV